MPDISPLLVAVLSALAVVLIVVGIAGRRDRTSPRCRACGADARLFAWHEGKTCVCGAPLDRPNSIRLARHRRWLALALGISCAALAGGLGWWAAHVQASGLGWRREMPTWLFARTMNWDPNTYRDRRLNGERFESGLERDEAVMLLDGELRLSASDTDSLDLERWSGLAMPQGDLGRRCAERMLDLLDVVGRPAGDAVELTIEPMQGRGLPQLFVRIDGIEIDGKPHEFSVDTKPSRKWFPINQPHRIVVSGVSMHPNYITVKGEAIFCGEVDGFADDDPLMSTIDDPAQWKLPVARTSFVREATASPRKPPRSGSIVYWSPPDPRWQMFFGPHTAEPRPAFVGGLIMGRAAVVGAVVGVVFVVVASLVGLVCRRRLTLSPPACARCGATARGAEESVPPRCGECGAALDQPDAVHWAAWSSRVPHPRLIGFVLALAAASIVTWFAQPVTQTAYWWVGGHFVGPERYGAWAAEEYLACSQGIFGNYASEVGTGTLSMLRNQMSQRFDEAREIALRQIARDWRGAADALSERESSMRDGALASWACGVANLIQEGRADDLRPTLTEMLAALGGPRIVIPACARVGDPIALDRGFLDWPTDIVARAAPRDGIAQPWGFARGLQLPAPTQEGEFECVVEWGMALRKSGEFEGRVKIDEGARRADALHVGGTVERRVLVLPADATTVSDPRADPFGPPLRLWVAIREMGERDAIWCNTMPQSRNPVAIGTLEIEFPASGAEPMRAVSLLADKHPGFWRALAPTPTSLPEEIVVRFKPSDAQVAPGVARKNPPVLWKGESTLRFRRDHARNLFNARIYERVDE